MRPRPDPCCGPDAPVDAAGVPLRSYYRTPATAPGPAGPAMLRDMREVSTRPLDYLRAVRRAYGPVVQFPIPQPPTYLIDDSHLVQQVLQAQTADFDKGTVQYRSLSLVTGEGLLSATTEPWRTQRPVVQPAFHQGAMTRLAADCETAANRLVERWRLAPAGSVVDADEAMMRLGLEVVGEHLFGVDLRHGAAALARHTLDALAAVIAAASLPGAFFRGLPTPAQRRFERALAALDEAVADVVASRAAATDGPNLVDLLVAAYPEDPGAVRDQIITFLVAGHETVASALTWALGLLAHHPLEQERVAEGAREAADPSAASYARAALDEALRLYPPAWIITREATADTVLGSRRIPAGSLIIMSPWLRHRDERVWPLPDTFLPERFGGRPGAVARAATTRADYLPFGTGPRLCIGRDFALLEGTIVLALLARAFRFGPVGRLPRVDPLVTLRPRGGMPLTINPR